MGKGGGGADSGVGSVVLEGSSMLRGWAGVGVRGGRGVGTQSFTFHTLRGEGWGAKSVTLPQWRVHRMLWTCYCGALDGGAHVACRFLRNANVTCLCRLCMAMSHVKFKK